MSKHVFAAVWLLVVTSAGLATAAAQDVPYTLSEIVAPFAGVDQTLAFGINDLGRVVGAYHDSTGDHAYLLTQGHFTPLQLPFAGASDSSARAINVYSEIVGIYYVAGSAHGFLSSAGKYVALDATSLGATGTLPSGINARGQVVGFYWDASNVSHGFLWSRGVFSALDVPFAGAHDTTAMSTNARGQIVGGYSTGDGEATQLHGFIYERGAYSELAEPNVVETLPYGINELSVVVGTDFIYERGVFKHLTGALPDPSWQLTTPLAINDFGVILELATTSSGGEHVFVATPAVRNR